MGVRSCPVTTRPNGRPGVAPMRPVIVRQMGLTFYADVRASRDVTSAVRIMRVRRVH